MKAKKKLMKEAEDQAILDAELDVLIKKRIIIDEANFEYCAKNKIINGFLLASIRQVAREYAKLSFVKVQNITDEDIHKWADDLRIIKWFDAHVWGGLVKGAKAFRDGEIKHKR